MPSITLAEEKTTDKTLTEIAETVVNVEAEQNLGCIGGSCIGPRRRAQLVAIQ